MRLTNAYWTKKIQMFSATYLVLADRNATPSLADISVETKALRLLEKTKVSAIRVCNHCGWQWLQQGESDVQLDEMFKRHSTQRLHDYPDWTTHRNFNVKLVFDVGLEFKNKPFAEVNQRKLKSLRTKRKKNEKWLSENLSAASSNLIYQQREWKAALERRSKINGEIRLASSPLENIRRDVRNAEELYDCLRKQKN